jgi:hypothetical protein
MMQEPQHEEINAKRSQYKDLAIAAYNFLAMVCYDSVVVVYRWPKYASYFLIFSHLLICMLMANQTKKDGWWRSAVIVLLPAMFLLYGY